MAAKRTLNAKNLEALGAPRLAELLLEISKGNATVQRRLRAELASLAGPGEAAKEVRKRLRTIARTRTEVDARKRQALIDDLAAQRQAILANVAPQAPDEAADLLWTLMGLSGSVLGRCDDRTGSVEAVFVQAQNDLAALLPRVSSTGEAIADRLAETVQQDRYGTYAELIPAVAPHLGAAGRDALKARLAELAEAAQGPPPPQNERVVVAVGLDGVMYRDEIEARAQLRTVRAALAQIADLEGDVDAFIAQIEASHRRAPGVAPQIAQRLIDAGRPSEAWAYLDGVSEPKPGRLPPEWHHARADALEALDQPDAAQRYRWSCFATWLEPTFLQAYLKRLPDFDDLEAEAAALREVRKASNVHAGLAFLLEWSAADTAAELVLARSAELDGDMYHILSPLGDLLEGKHPLAATLVRRVMIEYALHYGLSSRYRHAARHFLQCESAAASIRDWRGFETHQAFRQRLARQHGRKRSFWERLG